MARGERICDPWRGRGGSRTGTYLAAAATGLCANFIVARRATAIREGDRSMTLEGALFLYI